LTLPYRRDLSGYGLVFGWPAALVSCSNSRRCSGDSAVHISTSSSTFAAVLFFLPGLGASGLRAGFGGFGRLGGLGRGGVLGASRF
jgi:hypothetical protein